MSIDVDNLELVSTRKFSREYGDRLDALKAGQIEKIVLVKSGEMQGIIITPEEYERLKK